MPRSIQGRHTSTVIFIVAVFLICLLGINFSLLQRYSLKTAEETAEILLNNADRQISQMFQEIRALTVSMAEMRAVREVDVPRMRELFISNVEVRQDYIRALYLGTVTGEMYEWGVGPGFVGNTPTFPDDYDPRTRPWYRAALQTEGYALTVPYTYASIEALGITATHPVRHNGELVGILGLDLIMDGLLNLVNSLKIQKGGKVMLLDADLDILVNQFAPEQTLITSLEPFAFPRLLDQNRPNQLADIDGTNYLVSHKNIPSTGWKLVLFLPYQDIMSLSRRILLIILSLDILLVLQLGLMITAISRKIITSPLDEIIGVLHRIEEGDDSARMPDLPGREFQLIARLFNRFYDLSRETTQKTEEKVKARTRDVLRLQQENMRLRIIEEKERIYSNLHDSLGAKLTGINISNCVARSALERGDHSVLEEMLDRIERNTREGITDLKEILAAGEPGDYTAGDFLGFLEKNVESRLGLKDITLDYSLPEPELLNELESAVLSDLIRMIQELVTYVLKHSRAGHLALNMEIKDYILTMIFSDDGEGFNLKEARQQGFGIQNLYRRAEKMGGLLKIQTRPGKGTSVSFQLKLKDAE